MRGEFPLAQLYLQMAMTLVPNRQSDIKVIVPHHKHCNFLI